MPCAKLWPHWITRIINGTKIIFRDFNEHIHLQLNRSLNQQCLKTLCGVTWRVYTWMNLKDFSHFLQALRNRFQWKLNQNTTCIQQNIYIQMFAKYQPSCSRFHDLTFSSPAGSLQHLWSIPRTEKLICSSLINRPLEYTPQLRSSWSKSCKKNSCSYIYKKNEWSNQVIILHMPWQLSCHAMYKIMTWLDY